MTVTFCGNRHILENDTTIYRFVYETAESLIAEGADTFYLGGYGNFDHLAYRVMRDLKVKYPHISLILILPYPDSNLDTRGYDETIYPPLEHVPRRFAIVHRNRWMVENSDAVIAYVRFEGGGSMKTLEHAIRKKKRVFNGAPKKEPQ